jgi:hypothetical protein
LEGYHPRYSHHYARSDHGGIGDKHYHRDRESGHGNFHNNSHTDRDKHG